MFGLSRQSYYKNKTSRVKRNADLVIVRELVMQIRCRMPRIGTRKLYYLIKNELFLIGNSSNNTSLTGDKAISDIHSMALSS